MKILIRTNRQGRLEVIDRDTNQPVEGVKRIHIYVNSFKKASAMIEFKDTELKLKFEGSDSKEE